MNENNQKLTNRLNCIILGEVHQLFSGGSQRQICFFGLKWFVVYYIQTQRRFWLHLCRLGPVYPPPRLSIPPCQPS